MFATVKNLFRQMKRPTTRRASTRRLECEALEERAMLSVSSTQFRVNTKTSNLQWQSANASAANGRSVVVWTDAKSGSNTDIRAQRYDSAGNKLGDEIPVATTFRRETSPAVAMDAVGNFTVVWVEEYGGSDKNIKGKRFNASGSSTGSLTVADSPRDEYDPSIAARSNGDFVVSYTQDVTSYIGDVLITNKNVIARMGTASSTALSGEILVADTARNESHSSVARAAGGYFVIAYEDQYAGTNSDIRLVRYNAAGGFLSRQVIDDTPRQDTNPRVAVDDANNSIVVYQSFVTGDWDVKAKRVSWNGTLGSELTIAGSSPNETYPDVALERSGGRFVVTYSVPGGPSYVREVSAINQVGSAQSLGNVSGRVAVSLAGTPRRYLVTYTVTGASGLDWDVYGRWGILPNLPIA